MTIKLYDFNGNLYPQHVHEEFITNHSFVFSGIYCDEYLKYTIYYNNNLYHRLDGPAIEWTDGRKEWFIHGIECTKEQHALFIDMMKLKGLL